MKRESQPGELLTGLMEKVRLIWTEGSREQRVLLCGAIEELHAGSSLADTAKTEKRVRAYVEKAVAIITGPDQKQAARLEERIDIFYERMQIESCIQAGPKRKRGQGVICGKPGVYSFETGRRIE